MRNSSQSPLQAFFFREENCFEGFGSVLERGWLPTAATATLKIDAKKHVSLQGGNFNLQTLHRAN